MLVLGQLRNGDFTRLLELVLGILEVGVVSFFVESLDSQGTIVDVGREDRLRTIHYVERGKTRASVAGGSYAPENAWKLGGPPSAELVDAHDKPVEYMEFIRYMK